MITELVTAPAAEPVDLDEAKLHLRVDIADDDTLISGYILTATNVCEQISNHKFVTQTWDIFMDAFPGSDTIYIPKHLNPLVSVTHIKYTDEDDVQSTFASSNYVVDAKSDPGRIKLDKDSDWPTDNLTELNGVEIRVIVGYGDPGDVPQEYKQAIMLMVGQYYEFRENITSGEVARNIPDGVKSLLMLNRNIPV